ncbi:MAG: GNAT family N-acetyltransferase [Polaromonas sp.]
MLYYREATLTDIEAICQLGQSVNAVHHQARPEIFAPTSDPSRDEAHWKQTIAMPDATTFIVEDDRAVIGFVTVSIVDETHSLFQPIRYARIGSVGVVEWRRGQGIGRNLMVQAERWAQARGAVDVRLNVWTFNEPALALYCELGYEVRSVFMGKTFLQNGA